MESHTYSCRKCKKKFQTLKSIKAHIAKDHKKERSELLAKLQTQEIELFEKRLSKQRTNTVKCPVCGLYFQNTCNGITRHLAKVHPTFANKVPVENNATQETLKSRANVSQNIEENPADNLNHSVLHCNSLESLQTTSESTDSVFDGKNNCEINEITLATKQSDTDSASFPVTNIICDICHEVFPNSSILVHLKQTHLDAPNAKALIDKYRKITRQLRDAKYKETRALDASGQVAMQQCPFCKKMCKRASLISHMRGCRENPDGIVLKHCVCG